MIDNVTFEQQTTSPPTHSPTFEPTRPQVTGPTLKPTVLTNAPTTAFDVPCPPTDQVVDLDAGSVILGVANADTLCTVTKVIPKSLLGGGTTETVVPLVRSYDMHEWEASPGNVASSSFENEYILCYEKGCQINLPQLEAGEKYQLSSKSYTISPRDEYARFLETASFGTTTSDLDAMEVETESNGPISVIADYIESQMDEDIVPMTSHREFWRSRSNPRVSNVVIHFDIYSILSFFKKM